MGLSGGVVVGVENRGGAATKEPCAVEVVEVAEALAKIFKLRTKLEEMFREAEDGVIVKLGVNLMIT